MIDIINDNFNDLAKDYYKLQEEYEQLEQENKQLKEDKKKATEYIKVEYLSKFDDFESPLRMTNEEDWEKLLAILGDKENE